MIYELLLNTNVIKNDGSGCVESLFLMKLSLTAFSSVGPGN